MQFSVTALVAQDIISSSAIVLPQYPATSYVVGSGQTVKISSSQSITLGPGTWLQQGSIVSLQIANSPTITPAPSNPSRNSEMNWVSAKTYDDYGNLIGESKMFYDKYGKLVQNQSKSLSAGHVLASQPLYDAFGRSAGQTLAAPINNSEFSYKYGFIVNAGGGDYNYNNFDLTKTNTPDAVGNTNIGTLGWYYSNNNNIDSYVPITSYPYGRVDYYNDGTGIEKRSASVGDQLKMGGGKEESSYNIPVANELDFYLEVRSKFFASTIIGETPTSLKSQAVQTVVRDANGKEAIVIKDKSGNPLMSARQGSDLVVNNTVTIDPDSKSIHYFKLLANTAVTRTAGSVWQCFNMGGNEGSTPLPTTAGYYKVVASGPSGDVITIKYSNGYADISYNFYNAIGQLIATIAPNGVKQLIANGLTGYSSLADVPFVNTNEYDLQGRLIANTQTDAGKTEYIYKQNGSIRFSQNAVQRSASPERFSYTNYDRWGRSIESGEYVSGTITFASAKNNTTLQESVAADGGLTSGTKLGQVKTQYDLPNTTHGLSAYVQDDSFLRGAVSFTENGNAKSWYNYDSEGRLTWVIKEIIGLTGKKTIDYSYDGKGNVVKVDFQKNISGERFTHEYEYDEDNRLKIVSTSTTTSGKKEQARYYYYLHGPLKRIELAENLQGIDYTYTSQGWLKTINHPIQNNDPGKDGIQNGVSSDVFGMTMEYFSGDYIRSGTNISSLNTGGTASYNGNIMAQSWRSSKPQAIVNAFPGINNPSMVTYTYDEKYQFNSNKFGTPNFTNNSFTEVLNSNKEYDLTYDANGNINTLKRTNAAGASTANFVYTYLANTNKLSIVSNYATSYTYDAIGQMNSQVKTGGVGYYLNYDAYGKVTAIYSNATKTTLRVSFDYDESGNRIRKTDHTLNTITYYVYDALGNMLAVYDNKGTAMLQKELPIYAESRIGTYNKLNNNYQYELTDHLGNVRAVINGIKQSNGQADVVYYSDYYPFGSPLTLAVNDYRYGYQGQYAEVDKETGWNNFDLRMYDAAIGRWMSTDPYSQYSSPYVGMGNNPSNGIDPNGGYTWFKGFLKWASGGFSGSFNKARSGDREGQYYISKKVNNSNTNEVVIQRALDFGNGDHGGQYYPNGTIATYDPNIIQRWSQSSDKLAKFSYDLFDSPVVYSTSFFGQSVHLDGQPANRTDLRDAGIDVYSSALGPIAAESKVAMSALNIKSLNAGQFNKLMKGTNITAATFGGFMIRNYNGAVKKIASVTALDLTEYLIKSGEMIHKKGKE